MVGAVEFLRKAKEICATKPTCHQCEISDLCQGMSEFENESDLVAKVMAYEIKEGSDAKTLL